MFIILEGCDSEQKSALADRIAEKIAGDTEVIRSGPLKMEPLKEYGITFENYSPNDDEKHYVADGLHFGEMVYGPLRRGESKLTEAGFRWVEMYLRARGAVTFVVTQESHRNEEEQEAALGFDRLGARSLTYGGTVGATDDVEHTVSKIIDSGKHYNDRARRIHQNYPGYIGHATVGTLLVGDQREGTTSLSPFMPVATTSSGAFLLGALREGNNEWGGIGIIDANDSPVDFSALLEDLGGPGVVALGRKADQALAAQEIKHGMVPHPKYMSLHHWRAQVDYGGALMTAADSGYRITSWK